MNTKSYIRFQSHLITLYRHTHTEGKKRMGRAIHVAIPFENIDIHDEPIGVAYRCPDTLYDDILSIYTDFKRKYKTLFDSLKTSWQTVEEGKCYVTSEDGQRAFHRVMDASMSDRFLTDERFIRLMGDETYVCDESFLQLGSMADRCPDEAYEKARKMCRICHTSILNKLNDFKKSL